MLTLALFSHSPYLCGAERMLLNLARVLRRSGTIHPVLLIPGSGELAAEARRYGLACEIIAPPPWYLLPPTDLAGYRSGVAEGVKALQQAMTDHGSDAVLINTLTNIPAALAAVSLDIPSLLWVHGVIDSRLLPNRSTDFSLLHDELLLECATRVIANSNWTAAFLARMLGQARVEVIPNWTPVDGSFTAPAGKYHGRRLACLNTFDESKGHAVLLEAATLLKARGVAFELDLYGEGCLRDEMEQRFRAAGLAGQVRFQGRTTGVHQVYDRTLCVLNPSHVESFGMTLIEAMARKTPVIATRCGGPDDIVVDGQTGFLIERGDAAALADRIQRLLDSPELAERLGRQGFEHVGRRFSEQAAQAAFVPVVHDTVRSFAGYTPAVKTLAKIYRLWLLSPPVPDAERPAPPAPRASFFRRGLRFAKRRVRQAAAAAGRALGGWSRRRAKPDEGLENGEPGFATGTSQARSSPISPHPNPLPEGEGTTWPTAPRAADVVPPAASRRFVRVDRPATYRLLPGSGNWAGLDILVSVRQPPALGRLRLAIRSATGQVLREAGSELGHVGDKGWLAFRFPPIANAAGVPFDLEIQFDGPPPAAPIEICESPSPAEMQRRPLWRLGRRRPKQSLYCKTWYA